MTRGVHRNSGFTLLEVLVALTVAGLIYATIVLGLRLGMQAQAKQAALRADSWALADGWETARRALAGMDPGSLSRPAVFEAAGNQVAFTAALPAALGQMVDAALLVDVRHRLVLRWSGHATRGAGGERVLAEGVAALVVGYRAAGAAGAWQPDWNGPGLPGLVRLSVVWTDHARRPWPPIIAGPTLTFPRG
jgi:prepilin-type N-terminal cleavage/methylation domain-containing protein